MENHDSLFVSFKSKSMIIKTNEIKYAVKTRTFIKNTFIHKLPLDVIHIMIKYVGFNEIKFNTRNLFYKFDANASFTYPLEWETDQVLSLPETPHYT
jgi:hypothetical protein